jgi:hypothetical protein
MRNNRSKRREPAFDDEAFVAYEGPSDHASDKRPRAPKVKRLMAAPGRLMVGLMLLAVTFAFVTNALYLQKTVRTTSIVDLPSIWRGMGALNPFTFFARPMGETAPDGAPQPPRRPDKVDATPVPVPVPVSATTGSATKPIVQVSMVASADSKQVFAPPLPVPERAITDPVGALVSHAAPKPEKIVLGVQRALNKMGYGPVSPDGLKSAALRDSIIKFQKDKHLPPTGEIDGVTRPLLAKASGLSLE